MSNQRIAGRYTLGRAVGQGAGGAVWQAHDEVLDRRVALKRIGTIAGVDDAVRAEREARLAAQVRHPHVVAVYDLVTDPDGTWLVMEYVDGPALSTAVRERGPLSPDEAAQLLAPVADALVQAHALGIVHRDVKPSNILAGADGAAKLSDFGIARGAEDATLTRTGLVTGSPAYLAPEVATGGQATPASDVWAFGATLVHLLTARPPYHHDDRDNGPLAVVYRIAHEDPPLPESAGWLRPLIAAAMTKDPAARPTMAAVRDHLARVETLAERTSYLDPVAAAPAPPAAAEAAPRRRRPAGLVAALAVAAVLVAVLGGVLLATRGGDDGAPAAGGDRSTSASTPDESTATPQPPTEAAMIEFARQYVATASADPSRGFAMLTPAYQQRSPSYAEFWGQMKNPEIETITADPAAMTVTYEYRYVFPGKGRTSERVTLHLVDDDGTLRIDDAD
ncbi:serine/threonine-protein kinase [Pimelobacter simplex]|uniref:non-specific serine/threonine protein kinase n=3 Tax=Nocardioides simplex TaxID=2045 RepID=A0A0C5WZ20_NOCSI|nr:serine/threonine-protein kinase [Pimelobacter simplex]AJR18588.1 putative serine/threonine protein kinase [Pimelobacter simplex]GEB16474.1 hypothetical protein NSI01_47890 [Pimelobacter simplex]SFM37561.1 Serine/threonine protein kinase [Pimelobacter simplex]